MTTQVETTFIRLKGGPFDGQFLERDHLPESVEIRDFDFCGMRMYLRIYKPTNKIITNENGIECRQYCFWGTENL